MRRITLDKGLDLPIDGAPDASISKAAAVEHVALIGDDYIGMKPTMLVAVGDQVACGQPLFSDKKNEGVVFTAPAGGEVLAINRGAKRKFESLVIRVSESDSVSFCEPGSDPHSLGPEKLRRLLIDSGLWTALRTRPYGKIPRIDSEPASLFVTAMDSSPVGSSMRVIIEHRKDDFYLGMKALATLVSIPIYLCHAGDLNDLDTIADQVEPVVFEGPHPSGLPSTHIHFVDPVNETKTVWHLGAQDVCALGGLLRTGALVSERVVALGGPCFESPRHVETIVGASIAELCRSELKEGVEGRLVSGSILDGRQANELHGFLGRYHQLVSCLPEGDGRQLFGWLRLGNDRFSVSRAFLTAFTKPDKVPFNTAVWGGNRAIYPLGTYEKVMPLDFVPIYFLKSLASGNTEKAKELGCLELIEEDLALCSYVDPGKNDFGPMLRQTLTSIEEEG
ncbi:MAG: Na(+)-translocating NADH-quinone reductase subunit A [Desulfofustis sp.]|nr:Na(+)-translocating NADH-quinone reductase subunit A [Desulfofustis sp.]MBT8346407.1 Na(+)-translocating NADH-quinone reductase subunit A [Desulfofustis sp.]MBT8355911.1 Na(+)-translocating NADH-quinone reductase subunit A [Desulfofustis sp.]NNF47949.1 Na(+)-translocating NADH-quinone reductase subunit A [Desulfofustis sp.]NNK57964.1 Na(+)-translocating NADH-quinone reductase subunit A [Desulfofustis sp.]